MFALVASLQFLSRVVVVVAAAAAATVAVDAAATIVAVDAAAATVAVDAAAATITFAVVVVLLLHQPCFYTINRLSFTETNPPPPPPPSRPCPSQQESKIIQDDPRVLPPLRCGVLPPSPRLHPPGRPLPRLHGKLLQPEGDKPVRGGRKEAEEVMSLRIS